MKGNPLNTQELIQSWEAAAQAANKQPDQAEAAQQFADIITAQLRKDNAR